MRVGLNSLFISLLDAPTIALATSASVSDFSVTVLQDVKPDDGIVPFFRIDRGSFSFQQVTSSPITFTSGGNDSIPFQSSITSTTPYANFGEYGFRAELDINRFEYTVAPFSYVLFGFTLTADPGRDDGLDSAEAQVRFSFMPPYVAPEDGSIFYPYTQRAGTQSYSLAVLFGTETTGFFEQRVATSVGLAPIPEPEVYLLMAAGFGILAARKRLLQ